MTWSCPLCDFSTTGEDVLPSVGRHATAMHPAHLPERVTIADMLDGLPRLLREAVLTIDAPNPDGPQVQVSASRRPDEDVLKGDPTRARWSRTPKVIKLERALRPGLDSSLFASLLECSRIIWEAIDADTRADHPQPLGGMSWAAEIGWLRKVWPDAQAWLDQCDFRWIEDEMRSLWLSVAAFAGVRPKPRYLCPISGCRTEMHLADDDWLTCDGGHQHPGPKRLESQWRRKPPMPSRDLCDELRIPRGTLRRWHHEGRIKPTRQSGQEMYWLPWDAIALRYPDIVAGIEARDAA